MLSTVEPTRRKQLSWIEAILDYKGWNRTRLAREAGVDPSTLSKFLNDPDNKSQLQTTSIEKIAAVGGIRPYNTTPPLRMDGLADSETEPYVAEQNPGLVDVAVSALKAGRNGVDPWVMRSRALEHEGFMPGDILLVDLNAQPQPGDAVCAQVYDRQGKAETVMRIYEHPFLVAASADPSVRKPFLVDDERVVIRGVVIASFRPRRAA
uniref:hypothetical protein n=1 Tax=Stappia sp. TaxID=1870903 RepID=UPI003BABF335